MRQSTFIAILLTGLMFLLVLTATTIFLLQGRQRLANQVNRLEGEVRGLDALVVENSATLTERESELATAVAQQAVLAAERDARATAVADLERELNDVVTERDRAQEQLAELEEAANAGPQVQLEGVVAGDVLAADEPVDLLVAAADPLGLATVHITLDGESLTIFDPASASLYAMHFVWTPQGEGAAVLGALAINNAGTAVAAAEITVTVSAPLPTPTPTSTGRLDPNSEQRAAIEADIITLRGLAPLEPIVPTLMTADELRAHFEAEFADYTAEEARDDALVLAAFDFVSPDFDLRAFNIDLYSEQAAGFYDPETAQFVISSDDDALDLLEEATHGHEFVHALQDQYYALEQLADESLDSEAAAALRALAEGDATLVQSIYLFGRYLTDEELAESRRQVVERGLTLEAFVTLLASQLNPADIGEILDALAASEDQDSPVLDNAPPVLAENLLFPYSAGVDFVQYLFDNNGGFAGIDAAWVNPPVTTEHILHPERYLAGDAPHIVALTPLTATLGTGWRMLDEDILGEFFLRQYLRQQLPDNEVDIAALGWGGDRYAVYHHAASEATVMVLRLAWDSAVDAKEFGALYPAYPAALLGTTGIVQPDGATCWEAAEVFCLYEDDAESLVVRAPDLATAVAVAAVVRP